MGFIVFVWVFTLGRVKGWVGRDFEWGSILIIFGKYCFVFCMILVIFCFKKKVILIFL